MRPERPCGGGTKHLQMTDAEIATEVSQLGAPVSDFGDHVCSPPVPKLGQQGVHLRYRLVPPLLGIPQPRPRVVDAHYLLRLRCVHVAADVQVEVVGSGTGISAAAQTGSDATLEVVMVRAANSARPYEDVR